MPGTLRFSAPKIRELIRWARANPGPHRASYAMMFDPQYHEGGMVKMKDDRGHWPDAGNFDPTKIPPGIFWAKDQSTYLLASNHQPEVSPIVYAEGLDPSAGERGHWYDEVYAICGGDDFSEWMDLGEIEALLNQHPNARFVEIEVSDDQFTMHIVV